MSELEEKDDLTAKSLTKEEIKVLSSGAAVYSNRFLATLTPAGIKVVFTEQNGEKDIPTFRTGVILSVQDGIALYKLLQKLLKEQERALKKATTEHVEKNG